MKSRCDRLESNNAELSMENEQNRVKVQTLELELEMTKINSERDSEQLVEQLRAIEDEKKEFVKDNATLQLLIASLIIEKKSSLAEINDKNKQIAIFEE